MSMNAYYQSIYAADIRFKNFVRESNENCRKVDKVDRRELNFHGDEAKIAYENIIHQGEDKCKRLVLQKKITDPLPCKNERIEKRGKQNINVTTNSILKAVEQCDIDFLERNVTSANVNVADNYGWTPLLSAAFCGNSEIVDMLLKLGASTERRDKSGFTAAQLAAKKNHFNIAARLKEKHLATPSESFMSVKSNPNLIHEKAEFYCSVCKETFKETTVKKHEASTLHIFNTKPKIVSTAYGIPRQNKGYQMLLNKGWEESGGLGRDGDGLKYPVKTVLKRDRKGLGQNTKDSARVTHFHSKDVQAIESVYRQPRNKILRKRDREKLLSREARKERAIRRALS